MYLRNTDREQKSSRLIDSFIVIDSLEVGDLKTVLMIKTSINMTLIRFVESNNVSLSSHVTSDVDVDTKSTAYRLYQSI